VATSGHAGMEGHSNCRTLEELFENLDPTVLAAHVISGHINHIREVCPGSRVRTSLRMDDKRQTEIPVSRAQTRRLRELFNL